MLDGLTDVQTRTTLAILAGGQGQRMGMPKGLMRLNDVPILASLHNRLAWPGPTILVTTPGREKPPGHELFTVEAVDPVAGEGPLRGVLTALEAAQTFLLVVVPLDMPCLTAHPLTLLASTLDQQKDKAVAMIQRQDSRGDWVEPLPAAFAVAAGLKLVRQQLSQGQSALRDLAKRSEAVIVAGLSSWPEDLWINLNRPEDVEAYLSTINPNDQIPNNDH